MRKFSVTIVIPSVGDIGSCRILNYFQEINLQNLYVQFVFLMNKKTVSSELKSDIQKFDNYEIITVANDRYFGSCEENLYRAADFSDLFCDHIFCVGEHDFIDWGRLFLALERFNEQNLDVMGWNIKSQQKKSTGDYAEQPAIALLSFQSLANEYCQILLNNGVLGSGIAYPALISVYGPIDWAAYLGNHLFRKNVFKKLFKYKFSEYVYSLVYKQLQLFTSNQLSYGFYQDCVIWRISDDFLKVKENRHSLGWLEDHRTVHGLSKCFWIANLQHLIEIKDVTNYNLITNSLCLSLVADGNSETIKYSHEFAFAKILAWSIQVIDYKLNAKSFYLGDRIISGSMGDIFTVSEYMKILLAEVQTNELYRSHGIEFLSRLKSVVLSLNEYLSVSGASDSLLANCSNHLDQLMKRLDPRELNTVNRNSFLNIL
jgi:hypothetical protein